MDTVIQLAVSWYTLYRDELMLGLLACTFLLMMITLAAVRRCRKQIRLLIEKTREMTKVALSQEGRQTRWEAADRYTAQKPAGDTAITASRENEEIFGSVIQEIFP
ncbi:MAG: hypothetical protein LUD01_11445 [Clostridiales bacterium]|nr:hypothetical protein [Clostridiales bacterium]